MSNIVWVVIFGLLGGIAVGIQGPLSSVITQRIGPLESVFIVHIGGAIASLILLLILFRGGNLAQWQNVPWYALVAGAFGVIVIVAMGFMIPRVGALAATILLIAGQLIIGSVLDHYGWLGVEVRRFDISRLLGLMAIILGLWLTIRK